MTRTSVETKFASLPYFIRDYAASTGFKSGAYVGSRSTVSRRFLRRNARIAGPLWFAPVPDDDPPQVLDSAVSPALNVRNSLGYNLLSANGSR
jgi:hypothetical protein